MWPIPAGAPRYSSQATWRDLHLAWRAAARGRPKGFLLVRTIARGSIVGTKHEMRNYAYLVVAFSMCVSVDSDPLW